MDNTTPQTSDSIKGPETFTPLGQTADSRLGRWSWGACMFDPGFIIAIKNYKFLFVYILYFIPLINIFAVIGIKIYLGLNGRSMAENSPQFENKDELNGFMKGIDHAGKIMFFVALIFIAGGILLAMMGAMGSMMK